MAATKLSGLPALLGTEVAEDDLLYVADTSANSGKKMALSQFGGRILLDTLTNASPGEFDFLDIPQQFNRLVIIGYVRTDRVAASEPMYCYFNNDRTAANYHYQSCVGSNGAPSYGEASLPTIVAAMTASSAANGYTVFTALIENYAGDKLKDVLSTCNMYRVVGAEASNYDIYTAHDSMVAAITRITLATSNSPTNGFSGTVRLYGEF
jgi:hypothetical protein